MKKSNLTLKQKLLAIALILCLIPMSISAAPAYPHPIDYQLPDGSTVTIQLFGDEFLNWQESEDGYTLLFNSERFLEYAEADEDGDLRLSGVRARNERDRSDGEREFLRNKRRHIRYSPSQREVVKMVNSAVLAIEEDEDVQLSINATGMVRVPILLVEFTDRRFTKPRNDFVMLFNQLNLTSIAGVTYPGSMRDYFRLNSNGRMDIEVGVYGPYRLSNPIGWYGGDNGLGGNSPGSGGIMAGEAVDMAIRAGVDFSRYSSFTDPNVVIPHIIFAGYGTEAGGARPGSIWSHASSFTRRTSNGKTLSRYSCSPELRGNSGTVLANIGVVIHELGHSLFGLPDFYQTNNTLGTTVDLQDWCVMAGGVWNDGGRTPAKFSAYARVFSNWVTETMLNSPRDVTVPNPATQDMVFRVNTTTNNEYYLFENRQRSHWERFVYGDGLLVYHVDRNAPGWGNNRVNSDPNRRGYYVKQAGHPNSSRSNRNRDPYPQPGNTEITDNSSPNMRSRAGAATNVPITNITHNTTAGTISFRVMGGGSGGTVTAPTINRQPGSITLNVGQAAQWTVDAGGTAPLTFQWQVSTNGGTSWTNATAAHGSGGTTATFTTVAATSTMNGNRYRVRVTNSAGTVTTNGNATLTVRVDTPTSLRDYKKFDGKYGVVVTTNPIKGNSAEFVVKTPEKAEINLIVYDMTGNVVFRTSGRDEKIVWNLTNPAGRFVVNGTYLVIVEARGMSGKVYMYYGQVGVNR